MTSHAENTKRIAKNTLMLYVRMLFSMLVSLYTSRVVLNTLGVEDYGIYNVVGGVVGMLGFLTTSLGAAVSRYLTFDLGKGDLVALKKTFGNVLCIYLLLSLVIFIVGETIGLWFMETQLQIPIERQYAALWAYQFSIFSTILSIISSPYISVIIAHEKMSVFAYISIVDVVLRLLIVYLLVAIPYDKIITYVLLLFSVQIFDVLAYGIYSVRHFEESRVNVSYDKKLFKEILAYSGWIMNGHLAVIGFTQGLNILLNMFFGPVVNAARGIAVTVNNVCSSFCSNFQTAFNPQLTKSYAQGDLVYMQSLLIKGSKFSFYILFFFMLPLMFEATLVLKIWLGIVPEYTVVFLRLILCISLMGTLSNPVIIAVHATGNLKRFQLIEGTILLLIVPIAYILLKFFQTSPSSVFIVHLCVELCAQFARLKIVLPLINMNLTIYYNQVIVPLLKVVILSPILPFCLYCFMNEGLLRFFIVCVACVISCSFFVYSLGCSLNEREFISLKVVSILRKMRFNRT